MAGPYPMGDFHLLFFASFPGALRYGLKSEVEASPAVVRLNPTNGHRPLGRSCLKSSHNRTQRPLFNNLVGAGEESRRDFEAECLGGLKIHDEFEARRLFDW